MCCRMSNLNGKYYKMRLNLSSFPKERWRRGFVAAAQASPLFIHLPG